MKKISPFVSLPILIGIALKEQGKGWKLAVAGFLVALPVLVALLARFTPKAPPQTLFGIKDQFAKKLNRGIIPDPLHKGFERYGVQLSRDAKCLVAKKNSLWLIQDTGKQGAKKGTQKYIIQRNRRSLNILVEVPPLVHYLSMIKYLFLQYFIWLISLLYGAEAFREEINGATLPYLWIRPLPRWHLVGAKFIATLIWVLPAIFLSELVCFFFYGLRDPSIFLMVAGVTALGAFYFGAIFQLMGVLFSKPLPAGIIYGVFFEVVLSSLVDTSASRLTGLYHLYGILGPLMPYESQTYLAKLPSPTTSIVLMALLGLGALLLAGWVISRREWKANSLSI